MCLNKYQTPVDDIHTKIIRDTEDKCSTFPLKFAKIRWSADESRCSYEHGCGVNGQKVKATYRMQIAGVTLLKILYSLDI